MQFFQSLICLKGIDNRSRFFAIFSLSLFTFFILVNTFSGSFVISLTALLLTCTSLTLSTVRRLRDARLNKNWQYVLGGVFAVSGIIVLFIGSLASFGLLLLPALCGALLLTYPSKSHDASTPYILGYKGPVDLSAYQPTVSPPHNNNQRIEPTLVANNTGEVTHQQESTSQQFSTAHLDNGLGTNEFTNDTINPATNQTDIGELIRLKLLTNKKLQIAFASVLSLVLISVFISTLLTGPSSINTEQDSKQTKQVKQEQASSQTNIRLYPLVMPDSFDLYQSPYRGIIVHWQADEETNGSLWSQFTAKGDKSCQVIDFNKGDDIRTLSVQVENNSDYFASFSPLDSEKLIRALAYRGSFSLCGYKFSLKGSQAALGKNSQYGHFLSK